MDELPKVVIWGLQCIVTRNVCFLQLKHYVLVKLWCPGVTSFNHWVSIVNDRVEIKKMCTVEISNWIQQLLSAELNSAGEKKQINDGWYWYWKNHPNLTLSSLSGFHLSKIQHLCVWNLRLSISSLVCWSERKHFRVHQYTLDQTIRMIKWPDSHWIGWNTHHLAVVQSSLPEVGEWAIKKESLWKGKWLVSICDVLNHVQGVFLRVIETK